MLRPRRSREGSPLPRGRGSFGRGFAFRSESWCSGLAPHPPPVGEAPPPSPSRGEGKNRSRLSSFLTSPLEGEVAAWLCTRRVGGERRRSGHEMTKDAKNANFFSH